MKKKFFSLILNLQNNKQVPKLDVNPLEFSSKKIRVSLGSTLQDTGNTRNTVSIKKRTGKLC